MTEGTSDRPFPDKDPVFLQGSIMQKLLSLLLTSLLSFSVFAADFKEGANYSVVGTRASAEPEVVQYFSYACIHCANFDEAYSKLAESLTGVAVTKVHVAWLGGKNGPLLQRAHATAVEMYVERLVTRQMFTAIFGRSGARPPQSVADIRALFVSAGVSGEGFDKVFSSPAVDARIAHYDAITKELGINSTPAIIVNRKYRIERESLGSEEELHALVRHLLALK